ncbi:MAG TPA: diguanylate cyclase [Gemmatimonadaceae bacterium]|nr:diguanylate cyclase [Gemmatimonadaceae bacterium]
MKFESTPNSQTFASVLGWQSRVRILVAVIYAVATIALQSGGLLRGSVSAVGLTMAGYIAVTVLTTFWARRIRSGAEIPVGIAITADIAFLFAVTAVTSSPAYFSRVLILSFFIVHTSETYFGRAHAMLALVVAALGYVAIVAWAISGGALIVFGESLWSVLAFWATGSALVLHYGEFQRRLGKIVALFERAAQGDFTQTYDAHNDRFPDAVTRVGRAYNQAQVHMSEMVHNDALTGCLNRRGFDQALAREVARSARAGSELALIAIDLDHFKTVNDTHGHLGGDAVLREFGMMMTQAARAGDMVARTGGEEFSILLPDTGTEGARMLADRLCDRIRKHAFMANGKMLPLTASFGVVSTRPGRDESDANLKLRADEALYAAKDAGRNCVKEWAPEMRMRSRDSMKAFVAPQS